MAEIASSSSGVLMDMFYSIDLDNISVSFYGYSLNTLEHQVNYHSMRELINELFHNVMVF